MRYVWGLGALVVTSIALWIYESVTPTPEEKGVATLDAEARARLSEMEAEARGAPPADLLLVLRAPNVWLLELDARRWEILRYATSKKEQLGKKAQETLLSLQEAVARSRERLRDAGVRWLEEFCSRTARSSPREWLRDTPRFLSTLAAIEDEALRFLAAVKDVKADEALVAPLQKIQAWAKSVRDEFESLEKGLAPLIPGGSSDATRAVPKISEKVLVWDTGQKKFHALHHTVPPERRAIDLSSPCVVVRVSELRKVEGHYVPRGGSAIRVIRELGVFRMPGSESLGAVTLRGGDPPQTKTWDGDGVGSEPEVEPALLELLGLKKSAEEAPGKTP